MIGREEHDLHRRRRGRNMALGALLIGFVALLFGVTIAKLGDNVIKPEMSWSESE
ncbi:MAG: hypothetical protein AAF367_10690 [Pseudomonadota bacterium]